MFHKKNPDERIIGITILNLKSYYKLTLTNPVTLRSPFTDFT